MGIIFNNPVTIGPFKKLKSFIFLAFPLDSAKHQSFFSVGPFDQHELTTFWTNVLEIPFPYSELNNFTDLSWNPIGKLVRPQVRLPTLCSVWEPFSIFMQMPGSSPQLKQINCVYDGLVWLLIIN